ncbi:glycosyltransferase family 4 protein [Barnesiella intestinihominis]|uniref:glycosyltransferase family 4 protein n=1 Tax=Barnesiella intestinihominis TaxID=487174 RepID=UPI003AB8DD24
MNIVEIASGNFFSTYGGGQVYVKNIVDEMIRQRYPVQVISFVNKDCAVETGDYKGMTLYEVGSNGIDQLKLLITHIRPDVIHAHSHKAQVVEIGKKLHIPVIVTAHHGGIVCPAGALLDCKDEICQIAVSHEHCLACCLRNIRSGKYWYPFMRLLPQNIYRSLGRGLSKLPFTPFVTPIGQAALSIERKQAEWHAIASDCTRMIAPCQAISGAMQRNGLSKEKVSILPHGIPLPKEVPDFPSVINSKIKFFYVGRICYVKGLHILLKAFSRLDNKNAELHLIGGAGNKEERRYEQTLRNRYALDRRIVWRGKVSPQNIFEEMKFFHVAIHPTICLEIFGLNIAESLAMGKPVLATRCGGAEMQIEDGVNGWLVEPNNVDALAEKMQEISNNFVHYDTYLSTERVISIEDHCKSLCQIYKDIENTYEA